MSIDNFDVKMNGILSKDPVCTAGEVEIPLLRHRGIISHRIISGSRGQLFEIDHHTTDVNRFDLALSDQLMSNKNSKVPDYCLDYEYGEESVDILI